MNKSISSLTYMARRYSDRKLGRDGFLAWLRDGSADHSLEAAYKYAGLKQRKSKKVKK